MKGVEVELGMLVTNGAWAEPLMVVALDRNSEFAQVKTVDVNYHLVPDTSGVRRFVCFSNLKHLYGHK